MRATGHHCLIQHNVAHRSSSIPDRRVIPSRRTKRFRGRFLSRQTFISGVVVSSTCSSPFRTRFLCTTHSPCWILHLYCSYAIIIVGVLRVSYCFRFCRTSCRDDRLFIQEDFVRIHHFSKVVRSSMAIRFSGAFGRNKHF